MKTVRTYAVASILTIGLAILALGGFGASTLMADTSDQPTEWDVGSTPTSTPYHLADTSDQPTEWDVG